jgi:uncharacterized protein YqfA (UPF0365 family)
VRQHDQNKNRERIAVMMNNDHGNRVARVPEDRALAVAHEVEVPERAMSTSLFANTK